MARITSGGAFAAGVLRRSVALFLMGIALLLAQPGGQAQAGGSALNFFKNYFVTGDYVVAGVGLRGQGVLDPPSGQMIAPNSLTVGGVPTDAEVAAAFFYLAGG